MVLTLALLLAAVPQVQPEVSSAAAAFVVFQKNCAGCHGDTGFAKGYLLLDRSAMVKAGKVTPGSAAESILYKRINGAVEPIMPDGGLAALALCAVRPSAPWSGTPPTRPAGGEEYSHERMSSGERSRRCVEH